MSENLAILIGGIEYDNLQPLECCQNDVEAIETLLEATGRFSKITSLFNKTSNELKENIRKSLNSINEAAEVFFYYSGHGYFQDDEFFFCAKDFNPKIPHQTSLSNTELHTLIKGIKPNTVVKIIDSCASGVNLIKSEFHPLNREDKFKNFYQIASCLDSQNALAGDPLSEFTEAFVNAVLSKESGTVYYQDIIAFLRDYYIDNINQTPHFISQSTGREYLANDGSVFKLLRKNMREMDINNSEPVEPKPLGEDEIRESVFVKLKKMEGEFANQDRAQSFIDDFQLNFETAIKSNKLLTTFYDLEKSEFDDYEFIDEPRQICRILLGETRGDNFVDAWSERTRKKNPFGLAMGALYPFDTATNYNLSLNCSLKRVLFRVVLHPKFKSIKKISENILFAPSLNKCFVFESIVFHPLKDWSEFEEDVDEANWRWFELAWNEAPQWIIDRCSNTLIKKTKEHIQKISDIDFPLPDED